MSTNGGSAVNPLLGKIAVAAIGYWSIWTLRDFPWWYVAFVAAVITYYFVIDPVRTYRRERSHPEAQRHDRTPPARP